MVGLIFQNCFFSILTAQDRAKGIQRGALGTGFVCLSQKKSRMKQFGSTILWRIQHEVLVEFLFEFSMFERWTCPKQCVLEKLSQGPPQGVWRRLVDQNHGAAASPSWCGIVTPLKSIQMTLWHRYSTTNQSVEEVVYVTPLVILRIKSQTNWKLYLTRQTGPKPRRCCKQISSPGAPASVHVLRGANGSMLCIWCRRCSDTWCCPILLVAWDAESVGWLVMTGKTNKIYDMESPWLNMWQMSKEQFRWTCSIMDRVEVVVGSAKDFHFFCFLFMRMRRKI